MTERSIILNRIADRLEEHAEGRQVVLTLPENVARRKKCLVFGEVGGNLVVTCADPADASLYDALEAIVGDPAGRVGAFRFFTAMRSSTAT